MAGQITLAVSAGGGIDLDTGTFGGRPIRFTLDVAVEAKWLGTLNGAALGPWASGGPVPTGPGDCGRSVWLPQVNTPSLAVGQILCVRTNAGHLGYLVIKNITYGRSQARMATITLEYKIWA